MTPLAPGNARVKDARKLSRRSVRSERRLFLADGPKAVSGALEVDGCLIEVFATVGAGDRLAPLRRVVEAAGVPWTPVEDRALAGLSDAVAPAGVVGICRFLDVALTAAMPPLRPGAASAPRLVAICADVRDPGNAGTVVRCADAAGADAVVLAGDSVDLYNPKTVRASVGSIFHLPIVTGVGPAEAVEAARAAGLAVLAADGAGEDLDAAAAEGLLTAPAAWLFGNEAWGLPAPLAALADRRLAIPIHGRAESLNLATAAALCLYDSARAQRHASPR